MALSRPPTEQPMTTQNKGGLFASGPAQWVSQAWLKWLNLIYPILSATQNYATPDFAAPTSGSTYKIPSGIEYSLLIPAGPLASLTVQLPDQPQDRALVRVSSTQAIATLTVTAPGATILNAPTALAAGAAFGYYWRQDNSTWYRIQ
jgi:hypothetical protein